MAASGSDTRCARGSPSITRKLWNHAASLTAISSAISRKVRQKRPPNASVRKRRSIRMGPSRQERETTAGTTASRAVGDEDVAEAPHRLDEARAARIGFDQLAQTRDLHVEAAVEHLIFTAARELHQLFAGERLARMAREYLQHGELARSERNFLAGLGQRARGEIECELAELEHLGGFRRRARQVLQR